MAPLDLDDYRAGAERFLRDIDRAFLLHLSGRSAELDLEPIYTEHAALFEPARVGELRRLAGNAGVEEARRLRHLTRFALDGALGQATRAQAERLARLEAGLEVELEDRSLPYRQLAVVQANEPDAGRRAELEAARNRLLAEQLNPHHLEALERMQAICRELGWESYAAAYAELRDLDFARLREQTDAVLAATADAHREAMAAQLEGTGIPLEGLRRSDVARLLRAPALDSGFPGERLVPALAETLAGLGLDLAAQANIHLDAESRPSKSPRAFCSTPEVPGEVHLVVSPIGGREDYAALFHEAGHAEHYANTEAAIAFEYRHLGDNAVTESFAFLLEGLTEDPSWLAARLGIEDSGPVVEHARATRLLFVRRHCAKLAYELGLHARDPDLSGMPARYAELIADATSVAWSREPWLSDVDEGFYVACYLRAWALEVHWRGHLRERFGERWFESREAGAWLLGLWAQGQRLDAEELLGETLGEELDFGLLTAELV